MDKDKDKQQKDTKRSSNPNWGEVITQSIWNAITWLPTIIIANLIDDD